MRRVAEKILLLAALLMIAGCGFHPRGVLTLPPTLQNLFIKTSNPYGQLTRYLLDFMKMSHISPASSAQSANIILEILREDTSQQLLSVSPTLQTRQYNLILTVTFQLTDPSGRVLVAPYSLSETRTMTIQADQILGSSNEASSLYQQMRQIMVYDIMNRLASSEVNALLTQRNAS